MFAMNCLVNYGETLRFKQHQPKGNRNKRKRKHEAENEAAATCDYSNMEVVETRPVIGGEEGEQSTTTGEEENSYHPVTCSNCNTRIAVFDSDEVYHFFNVISSYS